MPSKLRPHQIEAIDAAVRALEIPPGKPVPADGLRATLVSACGTGKTKTAIHAGERLARQGRILILVPTLELLSQTAREWRAEGREGPGIAVCSVTDDPVLWSAGVRTTTSTPQLCLWAARERQLTVFGTYASLPVLTEAHEGVYGLTPLAPWDLVIVDEAHRTSGSWGKAWAAVHDQAQLPARRRLYLTATPRIWEERPAGWGAREGVRDRLPEELVCSMDDREVYGPVCYELPLADAIRRGLLARFQVVVAEVRDPELPPEELHGGQGGEEVVRGKRLAAVQTAVLEVMAEYRLRTMITFHHRVVEAEAWAAGLPGVAAKLGAAGRGDGGAEGGGQAGGRRRRPERVWAGWLHGGHEPEHRRAVLRQFGAGVDGRGRAVERAVLSNCRVLTEGVDVPSVDSVALIDPKGSVVDIVQAVGRALRQRPRQGKMATLVVPVFLSEEERPERMLESSSYKPLVTVLRALRAHDQKMVEMLAVPQRNSDVVSAQERVGVAPEEGEVEGRLLLRFSSLRDPRELARFVAMRVIEPERDDWRCGYAAALRYQQEHGDLRVPYHFRDMDGYPLGWWISDQRRLYADGALEGRRVRRLAEIGMVWSEHDERWRVRLDAARQYFAEHGTLCAPRYAAWDGIPLGKWLANCRQDGGLGADPVRAAEREAQLTAIDPDWNPRALGWDVAWQRMYARLVDCLRGGAVLADVRPGLTVGGEDLGAWLRSQRRRWGRLHAGQRERLEQLGVEAGAVPARRSAPGGAREAAWVRGLAAARQYRRRQGTLAGVPRGHVETVIDEEGQGHEVRLGVWLSNQRSRRSALPRQRAEALRELGVL